MERRKFYRNAPDTPKTILMAMALNNDIEQLEKLACQIRSGNCGMCANTKLNFCEYEMGFISNGRYALTITVRNQGGRTWVRSFYDSFVYASVNEETGKFEIQPQHPAKYGFSVTPEGRWLKNGNPF